MKTNPASECSEAGFLQSKAKRIFVGDDVYIVPPRIVRI